MAGRTQPTDAQLQAAWAVWRRPGWPATWQATQAHPLYSALVRGAALRSILAAQQQACSATPRTSRHPQPPRPLAPMPPYDCKRAAAGDRDDD